MIRHLKLFAWPKLGSRMLIRTLRILTIVIKDSGDRDRPVGALRAGG